ncbi:MAG: A/G-specific adenine glycosylase [Saezia sp.]
MLKKYFAPRLIAWQKEFGRHHLPWQNATDPYHVWLSEVMLQQTQVATVIEYYARFLGRFPSLGGLAEANLDEVLSLWSGLGYYTRARNLHECAKIVFYEYGGVFPQTMDGLIQLPGIGRSTAAAIAAFCFHEHVSILDGNVKRVLTRVLAYEKDISTGAADKELWGIAQTLLPLVSSDMPAYTQGLMDLGATLCLPKRTDCSVCPFQSVCAAHLQKKELSFPYKVKRLKRSTRLSYLLWLTSPQGVWLVKRPAEGVWGGLFSMPVFDELGELEGVIGGLQSLEKQELPMFKHVLTHFDWMLKPVYMELNEEQAVQLPLALQNLHGQWYDIPRSLGLGLPAPIRVLLQNNKPQLL